ncbi:MAG: VOC family protein [Acidimicrobiia bacterium]|nr:VOC family protein [Acidimicrobiia bacterium]
MSDSIRLSSVTVNAPDAARLAAFYADITGGQVTFANADWAVVKGPGGRIDFQTVTDHRPPTWPEATSPVHIHLDFYVDDLGAAEARVLAAGAVRFTTQPNAEHCLVFADPAGHPFCLTTWEDISS